ncbi:MAG: DUF2147 domain-containing protein, partial [Rhizobiales bacterium]|nr:DUF2147 domain-containing protein [Hyphomicrobiales bacterium]
MRKVPPVMAALRLSVIGAAALGATALAAAPAGATEPIGEWLVANGAAKIKIDKCGESLWGIISWEMTPGGRDVNNPDASKRDRPTLGLPILREMKATAPNKWEGEVYNAENGKVYSSQITPVGADRLKIEGCVLGFLCGGETWTKAKPAAGIETQGSRNPPPAQRPGQAAQRRPGPPA